MIDCEFRIYDNGEYLCQNKMMGEPSTPVCDNCIEEESE